MKTASQSGRLALVRHNVLKGYSANRDALVAVLSALAPKLRATQEDDRAIVVNIGLPRTERLALFCSANLTTAIVAADSVVVDVAADCAYRPFVHAVIAGAMSAVLAIREALRSAPVASMSAPCLQLCQQLDVIALMVEGYGLQSAESVLMTRAGVLAAASQGLRESVTAADDNVRCMDDLHYEISPALHVLGETFR